MKTAVCSIMIIFILFAPVALADEEGLSRADELGLSREYQQCMEGWNGGSGGLIECLAPEFEKQDARLNAAYKKLMAALPKDKQGKLREAQRAWLKFWEAHREFLNYDPPQLQNLTPLLTENSYMWAIADRASELENILVYDY